MSLALTLFPEVDTIDVLIEESMPWLLAWLVLLAVALGVVTIGNAVARFRGRSPVEKLVRGRFG